MTIQTLLLLVEVVSEVKEPDTQFSLVNDWNFLTSYKFMEPVAFIYRPGVSIVTSNYRQIHQSFLLNVFFQKCHPVLHKDLLVIIKHNLNYIKASLNDKSFWQIIM